MNYKYTNENIDKLINMPFQGERVVESLKQLLHLNETPKFVIFAG